MSNPTLAQQILDLFVSEVLCKKEIYPLQLSATLDNNAETQKTEIVLLGNFASFDVKQKHVMQTCIPTEFNGYAVKYENQDYPLANENLRKPQNERLTCQPRYFTLDEQLEMIEEPHKSGCKKLFHENHRLFIDSFGSTHNHQAWLGGFYDHIKEVLNIGVHVYTLYSMLRPLPFSLSDLLLVLLLHDIEKPWKYDISDDGTRVLKKSMQTKAQHQNFREDIIKQFNLQLTQEHIEAIKYTEGELDDYSSTERVMSPLAALAHVCDVTSARIWFDHPQESKDPWHGAGRIRALCG